MKYKTDRNQVTIGNTVAASMTKGLIEKIAKELRLHTVTVGEEVNDGCMVTGPGGLRASQITCGPFDMWDADDRMEETMRILKYVAR